MRTKNTMKNMLSSIISNIITIIIGVIAQAIFIKILGKEYLGLNSLFNNIISMLAIAEMGIGSAIIYNLYKPIAENNKEKIKSLVAFYKKSYTIIGIIIMIVGLIFVPFLQIIVDTDSITIDINIYLIYLLFLVETVFSYFLSYKRSILYAKQQNSIINIVHIGYIIFLNILQILIIYLTKNYYLYLIIKIIMRIIENIVILKISDKKYSYLKDKNVQELDKKLQKDIYTKVKAMFFHKIGAFVVLGTDNIIISKLLGLSTVGLYSNYYLIINAVQTIFSQIIQSTTASIGNMLVTETKEKCFEVFKKIRFLNYWLATFASISILIIMESFINIWIGEKYLLSKTVLVVLVINLYQKLMRSTYTSFKEAAGIYYEDKIVPIIEAILNIVISVICCIKLGLVGIFIGTIISGLALWCYSFPKFVYKKLFDKTYLNYIKETLGYLILFLVITIITCFISNIFRFNSIWLEFIKNIVICIIVPNFLLLLIFIKTDNFKYYWNIITSHIMRDFRNNLINGGN